MGSISPHLDDMECRSIFGFVVCIVQFGPERRVTTAIWKRHRHVARRHRDASRASGHLYATTRPNNIFGGWACNACVTRMEGCGLRRLFSSMGRIPMQYYQVLLYACRKWGQYRTPSGRAQVHGDDENQTSSAARSDRPTGPPDLTTSVAHP